MFASVWSWIQLHPEVVLIGWPIVTALVNLIFGAAEKYAVTHPRFSAVLALLEAAGLNARGVLAQLAKLLPVAPAAKRPPTPNGFISKRLMGIVAFVGLMVACSASFWQNLATVATAVAQCVAPIVLDVTGLATEDPIQIAQQCGVAVSDVYNWVNGALASAVVITGDGGAATHYAVKAGVGGAYYYCTPAQFARLQRIQARAAAIVDAGGQ